MWQEISDQVSLNHLLNIAGYFHDSCVKEMRYLSGAYVDEQMSMYPINSERSLRVIIQRQSSENSMLELEFIKLKYLKLFPVSEKYTCEILDSTVSLKDEGILWCDCGGLSENDIENYQGTIIFSSKLRWRVVDRYIGDDAFYQPKE